RDAGRRPAAVGQEQARSGVCRRGLDPARSLQQAAWCGLLFLASPKTTGDLTVPCCFCVAAVLYAARPTARNGLPMLTAHPQREELHNEVHARPYERLTAPLQLSHIALVGAADEARAHIASLLRKRHLPLPAEDANHLSVDLGGVHLRWEKHTEFHTCTFWKPLHEAADSFDAPALADVPQEWLSTLPGEWLVGLHMLVRGDRGPDVQQAVQQLVRRSLQEESLVGAAVMDGDAEVYTDLQLAADGFARVVLVANGMSPRRLG